MKRRLCVLIIALLGLVFIFTFIARKTTMNTIRAEENSSVVNSSIVDSSNIASSVEIVDSSTSQSNKMKHIRFSYGKAVCKIKSNDFGEVK